MNTFEKDSAYIAHAYGRLPLEFARASGSEVFGSDGKRYIDLGSGIAVYEVGDGMQVANIQRSTSEAYEVTRML